MICAPVPDPNPDEDKCIKRVHGRCFYCPDTHVLDGETNECILITSLTNPTLVTNCLYHIKKGDVFGCLVCKPSFYDWRDTCAALPANCVQTNKVRCERCKPGFKLVERLVDKSPYALALQFEFLKKYGYIPGNQFRCEPPEVEEPPAEPVDGCLNYGVGRAIKVCLVCKTDFYLVPQKPNNFCAKNVGDISNCNVYSSLIVCKVCANGYFPSQTRAACLPITVTAVAKCVEYDQKQNCVSCEDGFVAENNVCVSTSDFWARCSLLTTAGCKRCAGGHQFNQATSLCDKLPPDAPVVDPLPNCDLAQNKTACELCAAGYYPRFGKCIKLQTDNCISTDVNGNCNACAETFVLNEDYVCVSATATPDDIPPGCKYASQRKKCAFCKATHFLVPLLGVCKPRPISTCLHYNIYLECVVVDDPANNFYNPLTNASEAVATKITDCARYGSDQKCVACS